MTRTTFDDAQFIFKADDAMSIRSFPSQLKSVASLYSNVYIDLPNASLKRSPRTIKSLLRYLSHSMQPRSEFESDVETFSNSKRWPLAPLVAKLRSIKSEHEQQAMRATADISGNAFAKVYVVCHVNTLSLPDYSSPCTSLAQASQRVRLQLILNTCAVSLGHNV